MTEEKELEEVEKKKHPLRKLWDGFVTVLGIFFFLFIFALLQVYQEAKPKEKEVKPSAQLEALQKKVDTLYQDTGRTKKDVQKLYSEVRKTEDSLLKTAKANDEKALLKSEIVSIKQDLLVLQGDVSYPAEEKPKEKKKGK